MILLFPYLLCKLAGIVDKNVIIGNFKNALMRSLDLFFVSADYSSFFFPLNWRMLSKRYNITRFNNLNKRILCSFSWTSEKNLNNHFYECEKRVSNVYDSNLSCSEVLTNHIYRGLINKSKKLPFVILWGNFTWQPKLEDYNRLCAHKKWIRLKIWLRMRNLSVLFFF